MSESAIPSGSVASTARWTAALRAQEHARPDRLFEDPWAVALAGPEGEAWIRQRSAERVITIVLRTRFFDDFLRRIVAREAIRQIVLVAAGLDTRAFRLEGPAGTRILELDRSSVLKHREEVLRSASARPNCARPAIDADLVASWKEKLLEVGFDPRLESG